MIELKPITRRRFKCGFCSRIYLMENSCLVHETTCYKNPSRDCRTCNNTGWESRLSISSDLVVIPEIGDHVCPSCQIAETVGGKSYIDKNDDQN